MARAPTRLKKARAGAKVKLAPTFRPRKCGGAKPVRVKAHCRRRPRRR